MKRPRLFVLLLPAAVWLGAGLAAAATVETADSKERRPKPSEGSEVEVSFNPTVSLQVGRHESIESLMERLAGEVNSAGGDYYQAWPLPSAYGLEILRHDGTELGQLRFAENDPGIQFILLTVEAPGLEARLGIPDEWPSRGAVIVTLNDRLIAVSTTGLDPARLPPAVLAAIGNAGFDAVLQGGEIRVTWDVMNDSGINRVGFRSTDPALVSSDCSLQPPPPETLAVHRLGPSLFAAWLELLR
ncbi:MAG TPA: hypothetical protein VJV23_13880 [Candidatus Polarisedimenticolia bacterium]|nr:hypothetical protein [Candidatus Polarisedimenticolia bacterium]